MNYSNAFSLSFPEAKTIIVSGDIHGDFNQLVFKLCIQYKLTDTLLIVAGDCGFGFEKKEYYEQMIRRNAKRMNQANNWIVFVRGNHDNPAYFDGTTFNYKRFITVPDYTILQACNHTILLSIIASQYDICCAIFFVYANKSVINFLTIIINLFSGISSC